MGEVLWKSLYVIIVVKNLRLKQEENIALELVPLQRNKKEKHESVKDVVSSFNRGYRKVIFIALSSAIIEIQDDLRQSLGIAKFVVSNLGAESVVNIVLCSVEPKG